MLKVSYSGYYAYLGGKSYLKSEEMLKLAAKVKEVYWIHRRRYGSRRISAELSAQGVKAGRHRVRSLMREQNLRAIQPRSFVPRTTVSDNRRASPNLLIEAKPTQPKAVLVGDITYLPLFGGKWCYLASWQDKVSKRVVGWKVAMRMTDDLVIEALEKALVRGLVASGAIIHSDRGSQYSSNNFRKLLKQHGLRQSMSGKGNCYDNAQAESFWARFKTELVDGGVFRNLAEAISETFSYIEGYYNRIRRHSSLGYLSPNEFEKRFKISKNENVRKSNRKETSVRVVSSFT
jgi:transposase InsO family protein